MSSFKIIKGGSDIGRACQSLQFGQFVVGEADCGDGGSAPDFFPLFVAQAAVPTAVPAATGSESAAGADGAGVPEAHLSPLELERQLADAFDRGVREGRYQAEEELASVIGALAAAVNEVSGLRERIIRDSEDDLLKFALLIAKKVIRQEVRQDRRILPRLVAEAMKGVCEHQDVTVCLNPDDFRHVMAHREQFFSLVQDEEHVFLKPDETMTPGGCIVECPAGVVDGRVETQLDEIYRRLHDGTTLIMDSGFSSMPDRDGDEEG